MASKRYLHLLKKSGNILGFSGCVIIGYVLYDKFKKEGKIYASWTTNFEPSVKWDSNWDRREPTSLLNPKKVSKDDKDYESKVEEKTPTATRHLILIRHGQYNTDGERDKDRILTELGRKQAEYVGQRLKDLNFPYTDFISSTMSRAVETAGIIHKFVPNLEWKQCEMLCEGAPIPPEPPHGTWRPEKQQFFQDGARIEAAFKKYFHRADPKQKTDSYEIFVCHANVIRYFVCRALQFPPEAWLRISLNHCSLTWITIRPNGRVGLRMLGDSGFMPVDRLSLL